MSLAVHGIEVFEEALFLNESYGGLPELCGLLFESVALESPHKQPIYVYPNRSPPVLYRREAEPVRVVARYGYDVSASRIEPRILQSLEHARCLILARDAGVEGNVVRCYVHVDGLAGNEVEIEVGSMLFVPELLIYSSGGRPGTFLAVS